jgi:O-antigen/teichoic acid export membrane protein
MATSGQTSSQSQGSFNGNVRRIAFGSIVSQIVSLASLPVIGRLYGPAAVGSAAMIQAISLILNQIAPLGFDAAVQIPKSNLVSRQLILLAMFSTVVLSLAGTAVVMGLASFVSAFDEVRTLPLGGGLLAVITILQALNLVLSTWTSRCERFSVLGRNRVLVSLTLSGFQVGLAFVMPRNALPLILAIVLSLIVGNINLVLSTRDLLFAKHPSLLNRKRLLALVRRYRRFPLYVLPTNLLNIASWQLPPILITHFFGSTVTGYYSLSMRAIQAPLNMVAGSVSQVFFQGAARAYDDGRLKPLLNQTYRQLLGVALVPTVALFFHADQAIALLFGKRWEQAGVFTQYLAPWALAWFTTTCISSTLTVTRRQHTLLACSMVIFAARVSAVFVGGFAKSSLLAVQLLGTLALIAYAVTQAMVFVAAETTFGEWWSDVRSILQRQGIALALVTISGFLPLPSPVALVVLAVSALPALMMVMPDRIRKRIPFGPRAASR